MSARMRVRGRVLGSVLNPTLIDASAPADTMYEIESMTSRAGTLTKLTIAPAIVGPATSLA